MWHGMYWMGGGMWFFPLIIIVCVIAVLYFIFGRRGMPFNHCGYTPINNNSNNLNNPETPLEILKKRYAKGEITKEEFERMKKEIGNS